MNTIFFRGPLLAHSGYGVHSRQVVAPLLHFAKKGAINIHLDITNWGHSSWDVSSDFARDILPFCKTTGVAPHAAVQVGLPSDFMCGFPTSIGVTAGVEATRWPEHWTVAADRMAHLVFPSEFSRSSYHGPTPSRVIPESYPDELLNSVDGESVESKLLLERDFYFLLVGQITGNGDLDRKAILSTVSALAEEFAGDERVGVIVKACVRRWSHYDYLQTLQSLRVAVSNLPQRCEIVFIHGQLSERELGSLYRHKKVRAYVTATHGEGFGLPILEAAVCGLPIVATGWSGHVEYLRDRYMNLPYTLKNVPQGCGTSGVFPNGAQWAFVEPKDVALRCRMLIENYQSHTESARVLADQLSRLHSPKVIFDQWVDFYRLVGVL